MMNPSFRTSSRRREEKEQERRRLQELPRPDDPLAGRRVRLSSKHPAFFYYNKSARGKWNRASQVVEGMRWNAYKASGKDTPLSGPLEAPERPPMMACTMSAVKDAKLTVERMLGLPGMRPAPPSALEARTESRMTHPGIAGKERNAKAAHEGFFPPPRTERLDSFAAEPLHEHLAAAEGDAPASSPPASVGTIRLEGGVRAEAHNDERRGEPVFDSPHSIEPPRAPHMNATAVGSRALPVQAAPAPIEAQSFRTDSAFEPPEHVPPTTAAHSPLAVSSHAAPAAPARTESEMRLETQAAHAEHANAQDPKAAPLHLHRGPGYISSPMKKVAQLKVARADAVPPADI